MLRLRSFIAGFALIAAAAGAATVWLRHPREVWVARPVRPTADWQQRAVKRLAATDVDLSTVDRIAIHAISPSTLSLDPDAQTIGLSSLWSVDPGALSARQRTLGHRYRNQSQQPLFPTNPTSTPEHTIIASHLLEGAEAKEALQLWRTQALGCDEQEGLLLCHGPNFALSFYAGARRLIEVELCWSCQQATFFAGEAGEKERLHCAFAVNTKAAHALRKKLRNYFPSVRTEEDYAPACFPNWQ